MDYDFPYTGNNQKSPFDELICFRGVGITWYNHQPDTSWGDGMKFSMLVHVARNSSCLLDGNNKISVAWFEICFILQPTSEILTIGLYFGCSFKYTTNQQPDVRESLQRNISSKALTNVLWTVNHLQAQQLSDRPLFRAGSLDLAIGGFNKLNAHNDGSVAQFLEWQDIALLWNDGIPLRFLNVPL